MDLSEISDELFDRLVDEALEDVPPGVLRHADNVAFFVQDDPPPETPELLGVYDGVPLTERDSGLFSFVPPDTITLYKHPLIRFSEDADHLREEILVTIVHEIAHHHGIEEDRLHELGWG
ncbi:metallopeptidase family protein [Brevibacterium sp.]|uniref:metallopeptidase family protein n=1 Tax=Brevibacterium sp. TaxID=1701 RepID=UPI0025BB7794|nr:metallopeptidase family protein [Brevibacterium sp.]